MRSQARPAVWPVTADPWVLTAEGSYWVYGSNNGKRMPIQQVDDLSRRWNDDEWRDSLIEGMPVAPAWSSGSLFWAPTVAKFGSKYVAFFGAARPNPPNPTNPTCIGRAVASSPAGPFVADPTPFSCGLDGWRGSLDPSVFTSPDGRAWLYAAFADTESPLWVMELDTIDGRAKVRASNGQAGYGTEPVLGKRYGWEGRFIENPSMTYDSSTDTYLLAYSAGDWWTAQYSTGLARCATPTGPCTSSPAGPWLSSSTDLVGVGGLEWFTDLTGARRAVYASFPTEHVGVGWRRQATVAAVSLGQSPKLS